MFGMGTGVSLMLWAPMRASPYKTTAIAVFSSLPVRNKFEVAKATGRCSFQSEERRKSHRCLLAYGTNGTDEISIKTNGDGYNFAT